jgi:iron complex transport system ATP-binding protein
MKGITAEGICVELAGKRVLEDVTLSAEDGFVGLVGPNGAGKTTLLRAMNGVAEPEDGVTFVGGDLVSSLSSRETARRVATLPQSTDVSFEFTVEEVVRMGRHPYASRFGGSAEDDAAVREAMERVDVAAFADRSVHEVSGGERQRVLLARCLAQDADVFLLDEPTASLDVARAVETLSLVRSLVEEGHTAVAAIHDLDLAARFCDELVLLDDGEVVASGPPEEVVTSGNVESVFGAPARVETDPATGAPRVTVLGDPNRASADGGRNRDGD